MCHFLLQLPTSTTRKQKLAESCCARLALITHDLVSITALEDELFAVYDIVRQCERESVRQIHAKPSDTESGMRLRYKHLIRQTNTKASSRPDLIVNFYFRFQFSLFSSLLSSFFFARYYIFFLYFNETKQNFHLTFNDLLAGFPMHFFPVVVGVCRWEFLA
jgi:hypothetical protein